MRIIKYFFLEIGSVNKFHVVGAMVRDNSLVRKVSLEDLCWIGFDAVVQVFVGWVERFGDKKVSRDDIAYVQFKVTHH